MKKCHYFRIGRICVCLLVSSADYVITFANSLLGLNWVQAVWHSDGIPERIFRKSQFRKNHQMTKNYSKSPSLQSVKYFIGV